MLPSVAGAICLLLFAALLVVDLVAGTRSQVLLWVAACSLVAVPAAFLAGLLRSRLAKGELADLFGRLPTMPPDQLQAALGRVLGDPGSGHCLSPRGRSQLRRRRGPERVVADPRAGGEKSTAVVDSDGVPVAALVYDRSLDDDPELVEAVGGAVTIALENRRLHAEALDRLAELQSSRERIIAASDAERRRIERNLHDGAQQRLVTLALQLSLLRKQIRDDPGRRRAAGRCGQRRARRIAGRAARTGQGHPSRRARSGTQYGLESLAMRSAVPATLSFQVDRSGFPEQVEFAAYFVASEALANVAKHAEAGRCRHPGDQRPARSSDRHRGRRHRRCSNDLGSGLRGLADRVEAFGGRLQVSSPPGGGTVVRAVMPLRNPSTAG